MDFHPLRQACELLFELVSPGDLESHQGDLPGPGRGPQRLFEPTDVEDENTGGAEFGRPADRHRAHQAAIEKMLPSDFHGRQQAGDGTRGEHGLGHRSVREPVCRRPFDGGGHAFEPDAEVGKARALAQSLIEQAPQSVVAVQVRPMAGQRAELPEDRSAEHPAVGEAAPQIDHAQPVLLALLQLKDAAVLTPR